MIRRQTLAAGAALALVAAAPAAAPEAGPVHLFGEGTISTAGNEFGGTMMPDGREIYFSVSVPRSYMYAIFSSTKVGGHWTRPRLAPFSGHGRDFDPVISPDGRSMVFISDRPTMPGEAKHDYDVWMVERTSGGSWTEPHHLGPPVNSAKAAGERGFSHNEWSASIAADGSLYVASDTYEPGGQMRLYRLAFQHGRYLKPVNLGAAINGGGLENGEANLAPDGSFMLFSSHEREGGHGGWDIYISRRAADGTWGPAENLGPEVNSEARDYSPRIEPDGHTILFTSERNFTTGRTTALDWVRLQQGLAGIQNGNGNIYEVDLCALRLKSLRCPAT
jgi:Tol biopolymer transport system component